MKHYFLFVTPFLLSTPAWGETDHSKHQEHMTMDCSDPVHAAMDHCKGSTTTMDHSKMNQAQHQGMDHSKMNQAQHQGMDHSKMNQAQHQGMDHSKMNQAQHQGMDHSKMNQAQHQGMDHSKVNQAQHQGMDHSKHKPSIPVSDGSLKEDVPLPYKVKKMEDDPVLAKFMLDKLEVQSTDGANPIVWEAEAWIGKDINKLWLKSEGEHVDGKTEETETALLYSRAIAPFWDAQIGIQHDVVEDESRNYATIGIKGLAPYYFETDASLSFGKNGQTKLSASAEYEAMLTQKLVLSPEIELSAYGKDDEAMGVGSGLSDVEAGLRLRYEIKREFAPYIGVNWGKKFGKTADIAEAHGHDVTDTQLVAGIRAWF